jgi:MFS family permease
LPVVITSYLAANAIILPITGWLSAHLGRRNYFLLSRRLLPSPPDCAEWPRVLQG